MPYSNSIDGSNLLGIKLNYTRPNGESSTMDSFLKLNRDLLEECRSSPLQLKKSCPETKAKLQSQGKEDSQGTGNKVTDQEAAFASCLESKGFVFLPKQKKGQHLVTLPKDGVYYIYQANGSQQSVDFQTLLIEKSQVTKEVSYDLKHTTSKSFYLNDGWFHDNIIYVVTWSPKKDSVQTFIGLGQNIPTDEERSHMAEMIKFKQTTNEKNKKVGSLRPYVRFANQYSCESFTDTLSTSHFEKIIPFLG